jgi:hypothetical protein
MAQVQDCSNLDDAELVARCNMMMAAAGLVAKVSIIVSYKAQTQGSNLCAFIWRFCHTF